MMTRLVQTYGQIRLGEELALPLGRLVTLSVKREGDQGGCKIVVAPYRLGDETEQGQEVVKLNHARLTLPVKLRREAGVGRYVTVCTMADGTLAIRPYTGDGEDNGKAHT